MPDIATTPWLTGLDQFHLLRPWWLLAIPILLLLLWLLKKRHQAQGSWARAIDPRWLPFLLDSTPGQRQRQYRWWLVAGILASLGLAGPAWQELPQPVHKEQGALVILLDLSPSMAAADIKPDRITRARHKLRDILKSRKEGVTALVVYSGWAHVVSPLTDDTETIISQVPVLEPGVMSSSGSNIEDAVATALRLLADGGHNGGDLLIITDGIANDALNTVRRSIRGRSVRLSLLGVGTSDGAPIPKANGGFIKDNGAIVVARLDRESLIDLAHSNGGHYSDLTADNRDLAYIQAAFGSPLEQKSEQLNRTFDSWNDQGHWLALLLLPLIVATFRKGIIVSLLLLPLVMPKPALAADESDNWSWSNLWLTRDQQGRKAFDAENFSEAQQKFKDKNWKGSAAYRDGDYESALDAYRNDDSASGHYNRGNALAHLGKIDEAIDAYNTALKKDPDYEDAAANKKLLEDLKKQQQNQQSDQQNQNSDQQNQDSDQQDSQSQNSDSENSDSENTESENSESRDSESQDSESQNSDAEKENKDSQDQSQSGQPEQQPQDQSQTPQSSQKQQDQQGDTEQQKQDEQQAQAQPDGEQPSDEEEKQRQAAAQASEEEKDEAKRAMEQWLKKVPEDPGLFLRKKFQYQAEQQQMDNHGRRKEKRW